MGCEEGEVVCEGRGCRREGGERKEGFFLNCAKKAALVWRVDEGFEGCMELLGSFGDVSSLWDGRTRECLDLRFRTACCRFLICDLANALQWNLLFAIV